MMFPSSSASVRPKHLFDPYFDLDHDYFFKLPFTRERDAQSWGRCFTSHHVRYRAVPRTNRTLTTANTYNHSATSSTTESPACVPSLLWQCSCADASPGACTDAVRMNPRRCLPRLHQQEAQQRTALLAD